VYDVLNKCAEDETRLDKLEQKREQERKLEDKNQRQQRRASRSGSRRQGVGEAMKKSVARPIGNSLGCRIIRGIMGTLPGGQVGRPDQKQNIDCFHRVYLLSGIYSLT